MNILFFLIPKNEVANVYDHYKVRQALEVMEFHKYSSIPILARDGKYIGTITEGDLLWGLKKHGLYTAKDTERIPVMEIERKLDYQSVTADSDMKDLITKAMDQNYVPVVDDNNNFIGIITRKDIISYCYDQMVKPK